MTTRLTFGLNTEASTEEKFQHEFISAENKGSQENTTQAQSAETSVSTEAQGFLTHSDGRDPENEYTLEVDEFRLEDDASYRENFSKLWGEFEALRAQGVVVGLDAEELKSISDIEIGMEEVGLAGMGAMAGMVAVPAVFRFINLSSSKSDNGDKSVNFEVEYEGQKYTVHIAYMSPSKHSGDITIKPNASTVKLGNAPLPKGEIQFVFDQRNKVLTVEKNGTFTILVGFDERGAIKLDAQNASFFVPFQDHPDGQRTVNDFTNNLNNFLYSSKSTAFNNEISFSIDDADVKIQVDSNGGVTAKLVSIDPINTEIIDQPITAEKTNGFYSIKNGDQTLALVKVDLQKGTFTVHSAEHVTFSTSIVAETTSVAEDKVSVDVEEAKPAAPVSPNAPVEAPKASSAPVKGTPTTTATSTVASGKSSGKPATERQIPATAPITGEQTQAHKLSSANTFVYAYADKIVVQLPNGDKIVVLAQADPYGKRTFQSVSLMRNDTIIDGVDISANFTREGNLKITFGSDKKFILLEPVKVKIPAVSSVKVPVLSGFGVYTLKTFPTLVLQTVPQASFADSEYSAEVALLDYSASLPKAYIVMKNGMFVVLDIEWNNEKFVHTAKASIKGLNSLNLNVESVSDVAVNSSAYTLTIFLSDGSSVDCKFAMTYDFDASKYKIVSGSMAIKRGDDWRAITHAQPAVPPEDSNVSSVEPVDLPFEDTDEFVIATDDNGDIAPDDVGSKTTDVSQKPATTSSEQPQSSAETTTSEVPTRNVPNSRDDSIQIGQTSGVETPAPSESAEHPAIIAPQGPEMSVELNTDSVEVATQESPIPVAQDPVTEPIDPMLAWPRDTDVISDYADVSVGTNGQSQNVNINLRGGSVVRIQMIASHNLRGELPNNTVGRAYVLLSHFQRDRILLDVEEQKSVNGEKTYSLSYKGRKVLTAICAFEHGTGLLSVRRVNVHPVSSAVAFVASEVEAKDKNGLPQDAVATPETPTATSDLQSTDNTRTTADSNTVVASTEGGVAPQGEIAPAVAPSHDATVPAVVVPEASKSGGVSTVVPAPQPAPVMQEYKLSASNTVTSLVLDSIASADGKNKAVAVIDLPNGYRIKIPLEINTGKKSSNTVAQSASVYTSGNVVVQSDIKVKLSDDGKVLSFSYLNQLFQVKVSVKKLSVELLRVPPVVILPPVQIEKSLETVEGDFLVVLRRSERRFFTVPLSNGTSLRMSCSMNQDLSAVDWKPETIQIGYANTWEQVTVNERKLNAFTGTDDYHCTTTSGDTIVISFNQQDLVKLRHQAANVISAFDVKVVCIPNPETPFAFANQVFTPEEVKAPQNGDSTKAKSKSPAVSPATSTGVPAPAPIDPTPSQVPADGSDTTIADAKASDASPSSSGSAGAEKAGPASGAPEKPTPAQASSDRISKFVTTADFYSTPESEPLRSPYFTAFVAPNKEPGTFYARIILPDFRMIEFKFKKDGEKLSLVPNSATITRNGLPTEDVLDVKLNSELGRQLTVTINGETQVFNIEDQNTAKNSSDPFVIKKQTSSTNLAFTLEPQQSEDVRVVDKPQYFIANRGDKRFVNIYLNDGRKVELSFRLDHSRISNSQAFLYSINGSVDKHISIVNIEDIKINASHNVEFSIKFNDLSLNVDLYFDSNTINTKHVKVRTENLSEKNVKITTGQQKYSSAIENHIARARSATASQGELKPQFAQSPYSIVFDDAEGKSHWLRLDSDALKGLDVDMVRNILMYGVDATLEMYSPEQQDEMLSKIGEIETTLKNSHAAVLSDAQGNTILCGELHYNSESNQFEFVDFEKGLVETIHRSKALPKLWWYDNSSYRKTIDGVEIVFDPKTIPDGLSVEDFFARLKDSKFTSEQLNKLKVFVRNADGSDNSEVITLGKSGNDTVLTVGDTPITLGTPIEISRTYSLDQSEVLIQGNKYNVESITIDLNDDVAQRGQLDPNHSDFILRAAFESPEGIYDVKANVRVGDSTIAISVKTRFDAETNEFVFESSDEKIQFEFSLKLEGESFKGIALPQIAPVVHSWEGVIERGETAEENKVHDAMVRRLFQSPSSTEVAPSIDFFGDFNYKIENGKLVFDANEIFARITITINDQPKNYALNFMSDGSFEVHGVPGLKIGNVLIITPNFDPKASAKFTLSSRAESSPRAGITILKTISTGAFNGTRGKKKKAKGLVVDRNQTNESLAGLGSSTTKGLVAPSVERHILVTHAGYTIKLELPSLEAADWRQTLGAFDFSKNVVLTLNGEAVNFDVVIVSNVPHQYSVEIIPQGSLSVFRVTVENTYIDRKAPFKNSCSLIQHSKALPPHITQALEQIRAQEKANNLAKLRTEAFSRVQEYISGIERTFIDQGTVNSSDLNSVIVELRREIIIKIRTTEFTTQADVETFFNTRNQSDESYVKGRLQALAAGRRPSASRNSAGRAEVFTRDQVVTDMKMAVSEWLKSNLMVDSETYISEYHRDYARFSLASIVVEKYLESVKIEGNKIAGQEKDTVIRSLRGHLEAQLKTTPGILDEYQKSFATQYEIALKRRPHGASITQRADANASSPAPQKPATEPTAGRPAPAPKTAVATGASSAPAPAPTPQPTTPPSAVAPHATPVSPVSAPVGTSTSASASDARASGSTPAPASAPSVRIYTREHIVGNMQSVVSQWLNANLQLDPETYSNPMAMESAIDLFEAKVVAEYLDNAKIQGLLNGRRNKTAGEKDQIIQDLMTYLEQRLAKPNFLSEYRDVFDRFYSLSLASETRTDRPVSSTSQKTETETPSGTPALDSTTPASASAPSAVAPTTGQASPVADRIPPSAEQNAIRIKEALADENLSSVARDWLSKIVAATTNPINTNKIYYILAWIDVARSVNLIGSDEFFTFVEHSSTTIGNSWSESIFGKLNKIILNRGQRQEFPGHKILGFFLGAIPDDVIKTIFTGRSFQDAFNTLVTLVYKCREQYPNKKSDSFRSYDFAQIRSVAREQYLNSTVAIASQPSAEAHVAVASGVPFAVDLSTTASADIVPTETAEVPPSVSAEAQATGHEVLGVRADTKSLPNGDIELDNVGDPLSLQGSGSNGESVSSAPVEDGTLVATVTTVPVTSAPEPAEPAVVSSVDTAEKDVVSATFVDTVSDGQNVSDECIHPTPEVGDDGLASLRAMIDLKLSDANLSEVARAWLQESYDKSLESNLTNNKIRMSTISMQHTLAWIELASKFNMQNNSDFFHFLKTALNSYFTDNKHTTIDGVGQLPTHGLCLHLLQIFTAKINFPTTDFTPKQVLYGTLRALVACNTQAVREAFKASLKLTGRNFTKDFAQFNIQVDAVLSESPIVGFIQNNQDSILEVSRNSTRVKSVTQSDPSIVPAGDGTNGATDIAPAPVAPPASETAPVPDPIVVASAPAPSPASSASAPQNEPLFQLSMNSAANRLIKEASTCEKLKDILRSIMTDNSLSHPEKALHRQFWISLVERYKTVEVSLADEGVQSWMSLIKRHDLNSVQSFLNAISDSIFQFLTIDENNLKFLFQNRNRSDFLSFAETNGFIDIDLAKEAMMHSQPEAMSFETVYNLLSNLIANQVEQNDRAQILAWLSTLDASQRNDLIEGLSDSKHDFSVIKAVLSQSKDTRVTFNQNYEFFTEAMKFGLSLDEIKVLINVNGVAEKIDSLISALRLQNQSTDLVMKKVFLEYLRTIVEPEMVAELMDYVGQLKGSAPETPSSSRSALYLAPLLTMLDAHQNSVPMIQEIVVNMLAQLGDGLSWSAVLQSLGESDYPKTCIMAVLAVSSGNDFQSPQFWRAVQFTWPKVDFSKVPLEVKTFATGFGFGMGSGMLLGLVTNYVILLIEGHTGITFAQSVKNLAQVPGIFVSNWFADAMTYKLFVQATPDVVAKGTITVFEHSAIGFARMGPGLVAGGMVVDAAAEALEINQAEHYIAMGVAHGGAGIAGGMGWNLLISIASRSLPVVARGATPVGWATLVAQYGVPLALDFTAWANGYEHSNKSRANTFLHAVMNKRLREEFNSDAYRDYDIIYSWLKEKDRDTGGAPAMVLTRYGELAFAYAKFEQGLRKAEAEHNEVLKQALFTWLKETFIPEITSMITTPSQFVSNRDRVVMAVLFLLSSRDKMEESTMNAVIDAILDIEGGKELADEFMEFLVPKPMQQVAGF